MPPRSPQGRSPSARERSRSRSAQLKPSHSQSRSITRSPTPTRDRRSRSRTRSSSRGPRRGGRSYRSRSYSRSISREASPPRSSKVRSATLSSEYLLTVHLQIVVEKLTKNVTEGHLREIFGSFGDIEYLDLPMNRSCKLDPRSRFSFRRTVR